MTIHIKYYGAMKIHTTKCSFDFTQKKHYAESKNYLETKFTEKYAQ